MTKRRKTLPDLPTVTESAEPQPADVTPPPVAAQSITVAVEKRIVEIPMIDLVIGYATNRCDVYGMTTRQKTNLKKIQDGLQTENATLENGSKVRTPQDVVKWVLESVG